MTPWNQPGSGDAASGRTTETLPSTGLSLLATFAGSFGLIATGVLVRRDGRKRENERD
jgi:hypothetical protein